MQQVDEVGLLCNEMVQRAMQGEHEGVHRSFMSTVADGDGLAGRLSRLLGLF